MSKAYWLATYNEIHDADKLAAYAELALPAITGGGGRFIVRGMPAQTLESGRNTRTVIIEFDSLAAAQAAYESDAYQQALAALDNGADRDIRFVEGV